MVDEHEDKCHGDIQTIEDMFRISCCRCECADGKQRAYQRQTDETGEEECSYQPMMRPPRIFADPVNGQRGQRGLCLSYGAMDIVFTRCE